MAEFGVWEIKDSPVLNAMLSRIMGEDAAYGRIEDLDRPIFRRFRAYLYSGASGKDLKEWECALKLYFAAEWFKVPSVKEKCAAVLRDSVLLENVCDILSLADRHQDEELTSVAHDFISKNYNEVLGSENWEEFMSSDPLLVAKTVSHFAKDKNQVPHSITVSFNYRQDLYYFQVFVFGLLLLGLRYIAYIWC